MSAFFASDEASAVGRGTDLSRHAVSEAVALESAAAVSTMDSRLGPTDACSDSTTPNCRPTAPAGGFVPPTTFQDYPYATPAMFQNRQPDFSTTNSIPNNNYLYGQSMAAQMGSAAAAQGHYMDLAGSLCGPPSSTASINQCSRMQPSTVAAPMYPWMAIVGKYLSAPLWGPN